MQICEAVHIFCCFHPSNRNYQFPISENYLTGIAYLLICYFCLLSPFHAHQPSILTSLSLILNYFHYFLKPNAYLTLVFSVKPLSYIFPLNFGNFLCTPMPPLISIVHRHQFLTIVESDLHGDFLHDWVLTVLLTFNIQFEVVLNDFYF